MTIYVCEKYDVNKDAEYYIGEEDFSVNDLIIDTKKVKKKGLIKGRGIMTILADCGYEVIPYSIKPMFNFYNGDEEYMFYKLEVVGI